MYLSPWVLTAQGWGWVLTSFVPRLLDSGPKLCRLWATSSPTGTQSCLASSLGPAMTALGTAGPDCSRLPCGACGPRVLCPSSSRHWGSTWLISLAYNTPHLVSAPSRCSICFLDPPPTAPHELLGPSPLESNFPALHTKATTS